MIIIYSLGMMIFLGLAAVIGIDTPRGMGMFIAGWGCFVIYELHGVAYRLKSDLLKVLSKEIQ